MNPIKAFWQKICAPLDGFLWHKDISHPVIRPVLRNQILGSGFCLLAGVAVYVVFPWLFWFGAGCACMTWIFWNWARFFLSQPVQDFGSMFLRSISRFGLRYLLLAVALYFSLTLFHALVSALLAGLAAGAALALITCARVMKQSGGH